MSTPRRQMVRPPRVHAEDAAQRDRRLTKLQHRLEHERTSLTRWMARLKRAFHAVEKAQAQVARLERQIARVER